jgi:putative transposase
MPRKKLIRTNEFPYHVTARANNREHFHLPISEMWRICCRCLQEAYTKHPVDMISFVLMDNHYHMILLTPLENLDSFMYELNKNIGIEIRKATSRMNHIFGGRYKWCVINSRRYLSNCYRYVYQNPLRANIVDLCENYPFSSLYHLARNQKFCIPLKEIDLSDQLLINKSKLEWLNERPAEGLNDEIQSALKKCVFEKR